MAEPSSTGRLGSTNKAAEFVWTCALASTADGLIAWRFGASPALPAYLYFGVLGSVLAVLDVTTRRLPNRLVLPSYPIAVILLGLAALISGAWWPLARASIGMAVLGGFFGALAVAFPGQLGLGDVKLAGLLGLYLAWFGLIRTGDGSARGVEHGGVRRGHRAAEPQTGILSFGTLLGLGRPDRHPHGLSQGAARGPRADRGPPGLHGQRASRHAADRLCGGPPHRPPKRI